MTLFLDDAIAVNCRSNSSLKWDKEKALHCVENGKKILWDLDLGLFEMPYQDAAPLLFSLDHFNQEMLLPFLEHTVGCIFYKGKIPDALDFEFLGSLLPALNEEVKVFLLFEGVTPGHFSSLSHNEHFTLGLSVYADPFDAYLWEANRLIAPRKNEAKMGIVVPGRFDYSQLKQPYKVIAEEFLTTKWDGLEMLVVDSNYISPQGKRKLAGFQAAGGVVLENDF